MYVNDCSTEEEAIQDTIWVRHLLVNEDIMSAALLMHTFVHQLLKTSCFAVRLARKTLMDLLPRKPELKSFGNCCAQECGDLHTHKMQKEKKQKKCYWLTSSSYCTMIYI